MSVKVSRSGRDLKSGDVVDLYLRISRDPRHDELGVKRQERECRELVERRGWKIGIVHIDDDKSAFSEKVRPAYEALLKRLADGAARGVVAWHPDRLHRSPKELERFIDIVEESGGGVVTVQGGDYDLSTASGRMSARILGNVARHESEHKSERILSKMRELRRGGKLTGGGKRPYGYNEDRLTINESEAAIVREVTSRVLAGDSILSIIRDLNVRKVTSATGGVWTLSSVSRFLRSLRIAGLRDDGDGKAIPAPWGAIITVAQHRQLRTKLAKNKNSGQRVAKRYLLTGGLVRCANCGAPMIGRPINGIPTYCCAKDRGGCGSVFTRVAGVDKVVIERAIQIVDGPTLREHVAKKLARNTVDVTPEIEKLEARLEEVEEDYANGKSERAEYRRQHDRITAKLAELNTQAAPSPVQIPEGHLLRVTWSELGLDRQRAILRHLIASVVIDHVGHSTGPKFDAGRVHVNLAVEV